MAQFFQRFEHLDHSFVSALDCRPMLRCIPISIDGLLVSVGHQVVRGLESSEVLGLTQSQASCLFRQFSSRRGIGQVCFFQLDWRQYTGYRRNRKHNREKGEPRRNGRHPQVHFIFDLAETRELKPCHDYCPRGYIGADQPLCCFAQSFHPGERRVRSSGGGWFRGLGRHASWTSVAMTVSTQTDGPTALPAGFPSQYGRSRQHSRILPSGPSMRISQIRAISLDVRADSCRSTLSPLGSRAGAGIH